MMALGFARRLPTSIIRRPGHPGRARARSTTLLYQFLLNKWYFDELYDFIFVRPALWLGRLFWKGGDGCVIDGFGPDGVSARVLDVTRNVVRLQTGYLYHYAFAMLIGAAALITWFMFAGGSALMASWPILSVTTFLPLVGALFILALRGDDEAGKRNARWVALWTTLVTLRGVADPGLALRRRLARIPVRREAAPGSAATAPTTWASTASRCRS